MKRRLLALSILLMLFATPALADATNPAAESGTPTLRGT
jgi:hypothetical protein